MDEINDLKMRIGHFLNNSALREGEGVMGSIFYMKGFKPTKYEGT